MADGCFMPTADHEIEICRRIRRDASMTIDEFTRYKKEAEKSRDIETARFFRERVAEMEKTRKAADFLIKQVNVGGYLPTVPKELEFEISHIAGMATMEAANV